MKFENLEVDNLKKPEEVDEFSDLVGDIADHAEKTGFDPKKLKEEIKDLTKLGEMAPPEKDYLQSIADNLESGKKTPDYGLKGEFGKKRFGNKIEPFKNGQEPEIKKGKKELLQEVSSKYLREIEGTFKKYEPKGEFIDLSGLKDVEIDYLSELQEKEGYISFLGIEEKNLTPEKIKLLKSLKAACFFTDKIKKIIDSSK